MNETRLTRLAGTFALVVGLAVTVLLIVFPGWAPIHGDSGALFGPIVAAAGVGTIISNRPRKTVRRAPRA